jgi:hypothetical protein
MLQLFYQAFDLGYLERSQVNFAHTTRKHEANLGAGSLLVVPQ